MARKTTNIEKRRRLDELYATGDEVRFNKGGVVPEGEGGDDDVVVWVQPPDPLQREQAVRAAQAAKARSQLAMKDDESQTYLDAQLFLSELDREQRINYIVDATTTDIRSRAIREVLEDEEWEDFTALQDAMREWGEADFPDTEEWASVRRRDEEYGQQVQKRIKEIMEDTREGLNMLSEEELAARARKRHGEVLANQDFMYAYESHMLFYACRDDEDHTELFFGSADELRRKPEFVQMALANKLSEFIKDPKQAKNSPRVAPGSDSSVLPSAPETSEASTPEEQIAS